MYKSNIKIVLDHPKTTHYFDILVKTILASDKTRPGNIFNAFLLLWGFYLSAAAIIAHEITILVLHGLILLTLPPRGLHWYEDMPLFRLQTQDLLLTCTTLRNTPALFLQSPQQTIHPLFSNSFSFILIFSYLFFNCFLSLVLRFLPWCQQNRLLRLRERLTVIILSVETMNHIRCRSGCILLENWVHRELVNTFELIIHLMICILKLLSLSDWFEWAFLHVLVFDFLSLPHLLILLLLVVLVEFLTTQYSKSFSASTTWLGAPSSANKRRLMVNAQAMCGV